MKLSHALKKKVQINEVRSFFKWMHQHIRHKKNFKSLKGFNLKYTERVQPMQQLTYNNGSENGSLLGGNEQSSQNRWANPETDKFVELWKENIVLIESSRSHETWLKIRAEINKLGKEKTV